MAGKPKPIDREQVIKLARLGCTQEEIAEFVGVSLATIQRRFAATIARARASLKMSIRRAQYVRGVRDRSDTMLVHLGKCYLDQSYGSDGGTTAQEVLARILADHAARNGSNGTS
jgi:hypothetical protein